MTRDDQFNDYFQRYAAASTGTQPEAVAEFYDHSFVAAGPKGAAAFQNDGAFLDWLRQVHDFNVRTGLASMAAEAVEHVPVGPGYWLVTVRWAATFRKIGDRSIRFWISYLLRNTQAGPKIVAYVSHEDQEDAMRAHGLL
jgi:hypothetical protein